MHSLSLPKESKCKVDLHVPVYFFLPSSEKLELKFMSISLPFFLLLLITSIRFTLLLSKYSKYHQQLAFSSHFPENSVELRVNMDGNLEFFKAITHRVRVEGRLQLCPGSNERMEALSNMVALRDCYKNTWQVEIDKSGGVWYFTRGWMECYEANMLEFGDVLLFEYKGNAMFDFTIIGSNGCSEERARGPSFIVKDEEMELEDEEEGANNVDIKQKVEEDTETDETYKINTSDSEYAGGEESDDIYDLNLSDADFAEEEESIDAYEINLNDAEYAEEESNVSSEDFFQLEEESEDDEVYVPKKASKPKAKCKASEQPGNSSERVTQLGVGSMPQRRKYRRKSGTDCYGSEIFRSGLIPRPVNPFWVTRSRPASRGNELYIPYDVIKDFKLKIPAKFHLVDSDGRKWGTKIRQWGEGRLWCVRGWDTLCRVNGIERNDVCICEIVQGENLKDFGIKVKVLRN